MAIERARMQMDQDFIDSEDRWQAWPMLPMKRVDGGSVSDRCGILISGYERVVFLTNMFDAHKYMSIGDMRRVEYSSWQDLLAEWMVD